VVKLVAGLASKAALRIKIFIKNQKKWVCKNQEKFSSPHKETINKNISNLAKHHSTPVGKSIPGYMLP
jgi:hypothetical protein